MTKSPPLSNRVTWLDAVRGLAVLGMLETHTVNALLAPAWKEHPGFPWLAFLNGLVAPAFLWIAGYAQGLGWGRRVAGGDTRWPTHTMKRLAGIWLLAYGLHFPWGWDAPAWQAFFATDVLQCLSISLLLTMLVEKLVPSRAVAGMAAAGLLIVVAGFWPQGPLTGFWPLDAYLDQSGVSLFPLVPWAAFVLLGALMGRLALRPLWLGAVGAALTFTPQPDAFSKSHPAFFLERLGWLFLLVAVIMTLGKIGRFPQWLLFAGRESLVIYVAHLTFLFALPVGRWIGPTLPPWQVAVAALVLAAASFGVAWGLHWWKRRSPPTQVA